MSPEVTTLYQNLLKNSQKPESKALSLLISPNDLKKTFDFILQVIKKNDINLSTGQSLYFRKETYKLPRTLCLIRTLKGEYKLFLETKSKIADGTKLPIIKHNGSYKTGKKALCLSDQDVTPYIHFIQHVENEYAEQEILYETRVSQALNPNHAQPLFLGPKTQKKSHNYLSTYSQLALNGNLFDFKRSYLYTGLNNEEIEKLHSSFVSQLLTGLKSMHDQNMVHQDIKSTNILVDEHLNLKYCDFGFAAAHLKVPSRSFYFATATHGFESPEIYYIKPKEKNDPKENETPLGGLFYASHLKPALAIFSSPPVYHVPHQANDVYALGIEITTLFMREFNYNEPGAKEAGILGSHPLVRGMCSPLRAYRFTVEDSLLMHKILYQNNLLFHWTSPIGVGLLHFIGSHEALIKHVLFEKLPIQNRQASLNQLEEMQPILELKAKRRKQLEALCEDINLLRGFIAENQRALIMAQNGPKITSENPYAELEQTFGQAQEKFTQAVQKLKGEINKICYTTWSPAEDLTNLLMTNVCSTIRTANYVETLLGNLKNENENGSGQLYQFQLHYHSGHIRNEISTIENNTRALTNCLPKLREMSKDMYSP